MLLLNKHGDHRIYLFRAKFYQLRLAHLWWNKCAQQLVGRLVTPELIGLRMTRLSDDENNDK